MFYPSPDTPSAPAARPRRHSVVTHARGVRRLVHTSPSTETVVAVLGRGPSLTECSGLAATCDLLLPPEGVHRVHLTPAEVGLLARAGLPVAVGTARADDLALLASSRPGFGYLVVRTAAGHRPFGFDGSVTLAAATSAARHVARLLPPAGRVPLDVAAAAAAGLRDALRRSGADRDAVAALHAVAQLADD